MYALAHLPGSAGCAVGARCLLCCCAVLQVHGFTLFTAVLCAVLQAHGFTLVADLNQGATDRGFDRPMYVLQRPEAA